jgi:hypothetical protein
MRLVEIFLPLADNDGHRFGQTMFDDVKRELSECFGGVTVYPRAPASGVWKEEAEKTEDDLVVFEVMTPNVDNEWWQSYGERLEKIFHQEKVIVRAYDIELL